jgi:hypothetical protein
MKLKALLPGFRVAFCMKASDNKNGIIVNKIKYSIGKSANKYATSLLVNLRISKWIFSN